MLNVTRLKMLREVAGRGTIAAAAEALFMSPSAVSQQMSVLEREAGVALLEREGRGVRLTDAGRKLVENTERILAEIEHAEADLAASAVGISGRVRISAFPTAARSILVPALAHLHAAHPNLRLSMVDLEPEEALPALKARDVDVALIYEWDLLPSLEDPGIEREEIFAEEVFLLLPVDHPLAKRNTPIAIDELADEEWVVGRDATSMLDLVTAVGLRAGFEPRTDLHSMDFNVITAAVEAGLGVALGPSLALLPTLAGFATPPRVAVRKIAGTHLNRRIWAATRRGSGDAPGIAVVLQALREASAAVAERVARRP